MSTPLAQFRERLGGTWLCGRRAIALTIADSSELAFAVEIRGDELETFWPSAIAIAQAAGRPPIAVLSWIGSTGDWEEAIREADFFNRFEYSNGPGEGEGSPASIVRAADAIDVAGFLLQLDVARRHFEEELDALARTSGGPHSFVTILESEREDCRISFGEAPSAQAILAAIGSDEAGNTHAIERYLLQWERERGHRRDPGEARQPWFEPRRNERVALMFLPITDSWDALAYMHWFGADRFRSANAIALGRHWRKLYGAELVAHYGTMLQCVVARPPTEPDAAWQLACEHDLLSPGTLAPSGTRLRHYAQALVDCERWFLHERP